MQLGRLLSWSVASLPFPVLWKAGWHHTSLTGGLLLQRARHENSRVTVWPHWTSSSPSQLKGRNILLNMSCSTWSIAVDFHCFISQTNTSLEVSEQDTCFWAFLSWKLFKYFLEQPHRQNIQFFSKCKAPATFSRADGIADDARTVAFLDHISTLLEMRFATQNIILFAQQFGCR